jgi:hypothetical protein
MNNKVLKTTSIILILVMCLVRFGLAVIAYINPEFLMAELGFPSDTNTQASYLARVWAIRDIVISALVIYFLIKDKKVLIAMIIACIAIDLTDIISAHLGFVDGIFNQKDSWNLKLTAIYALIPEILGFVFLRLSKPLEITKN